MREVKLIASRTLMIVLVTLVCAFIPNFLAFLNMMGSVGASTLAFILPPIFYVKVLKEPYKLGWPTIVFNYFLVIFGAFGGIFSFVVAAINLAHSKKS